MVIETARNLHRYMEDQGTREEMENEVKAAISPTQQVSESDLKQLSKILESGYGPLWQGEENYRNAILGNSTQILRIYDGDSLAAGLTIDNSRISSIAVDPNFQGKGLGVKLFEEASKAIPDVWISVGVTPKSEGMIATLTSKKLNFMPVEDKGRIEDLFKNTNQGKDRYAVDVTRVEFPLLSQRLEAKGIKQDAFVAYSRAGSTHGADYSQIIFQNQPQPK
jgi:ribosomal protein S18 acetylase RimI-like enzyme